MTSLNVVAPGAETPSELRNLTPSELIAQGFAAALEMADQLGADKALGEAALPKLALAVLNATVEGFVYRVPVTKGKKTKYVAFKVPSIVPDDKGGISDVDQVEMFYQRYITSQGRKSLHARPTDGPQAKTYNTQITKLRKFRELGEWSVGRGVELMDMASDVFAKFNPNPMQKEEASKGAYVFYQDVAKFQLKEENASDLITREQVEALIIKPVTEKEPESLEDALGRALEILQNLIDRADKGQELEDGELPKAEDNHPLIVSAAADIKERVAQIAKAGKIAKLQAELAALAS